MFLKKHRPGNLVVGIMLTMLLGFGSLIMPGTANATDEGTVFTVEGNAVEEVSFTMAELQAMPATTKTYGASVCKGVDFKYLMEYLNINNPNWTIKVKTVDSTNGITLNFSYVIDPLLTYEMDGSAITDKTPLKLYHGDGANNKSVYKYVTGIIVTKPDSLDSPALVADTTGNELGQAIDITFTTDAAWEAAISGITVNGSDLTADQYGVTAGNINIAASVFATAGDYPIVVKATGYADATVTQTINEASAQPATYIVTFDVTPEDATVVVKDSKSVEMTAEADGTYKLEAGEYSYTVTKEGYKTAEKTIIVEATDITETLSLEEIITPEPKTWYVDGSGSADFTTIQAAVTAANAGDTIVVKDGTYTENVVVDKSLTIQSENGTAMTTVIAADSARSVFYVSASGVVIDGFSVKGPTGKSVAGIELASVNDCVIQNNDCSGCSNGIYLGGTASNNAITENHCYENTKSGISARGTANGNFISKNTVNNGVDFCIKDTSKNNVLWLNNIMGKSVDIQTENIYSSPNPLTYTYNSSTYTSYLGNYWQNYAAVDEDGNGVGDTPYNSGKISDNYPLVVSSTNYENTPPSPTVAAAFTATPISGTVPLTVNFTDQSTGNPASWAWDFDNDGTVDSTDQNPTYVYSTVGTYSVKLTVTNAVGNDEEVKTDYIVVNPAPVQAKILLSINSGIPGVTTFITGSGFDANTAGTIWFDTNDNGVWDEGEPSTGVNTDEDGAISLLTSLTVPSASTGSYTVRADIGGIGATASFTITASGIIANPLNGTNRVGNGFTVTGSGFAPSTSFKLFIDRNGNGVFDEAMSHDDTTSASGTVLVKGMSWPSSPTGVYNVLLDLGKNGTIDASASIVITPSIYVGTPVNNPGSNIGMNIDGFGANATGYVWFDTNGNGVWDEDENRVPVTTSDAGTVTTPGLYVPAVTPGVYQVCADIPACGLKAPAATYTVRGIALTPSSGIAGTSIAITGYGYFRNMTEGYYIWFDTNGNGAWDADETKVDVTTDADGTISPVSLTVPAVPAGDYNVCASFGWPVNFAVFTVEGITPEPATYTVTFKVTPEDATVVVKDSKNVEVAAETDGTYKLEAGEYNYTVTKEGYKTAEGTITVEATDITETVSLEKTIIPEPKTWYVDDSGSADFTTIQAAVTAANAGDTIIVKDGTYTENVAVDKSLVIKSENGADLTAIQAANAKADVFLVTAANVTIDGFAVSGATDRDKSGIAILGGSSGSCTIMNNKCSGNYQGISIQVTKDNTVSNNTCTGSGGYGIYLANTTGNSITDNICIDNPGDSEYAGYGLCLFDNANNNTISGNISNSNKEGIRVKNARTNSIYNNTFSKNNIGVNVLFDGIENVFYLNNFVDNATEIAWGEWGTVIGNSWNSPTKMSYSFNGNQYNSLVGNYWSSYVGEDADGNGIGDTPYQTVKTDKDNYPLMGQWKDGVITGAAVATYTVTFDVTPEDANVVVKDSENVEVIAETDGTYNLETGTYSYTVSAEGYITKAGTFIVVDEAQTITVVLEKETVQPETPQYKVIPAPDAIYTIGETPADIQTMTVNAGQSGFKYFEASITPVKAHEGTETVVFTHVRNDIQLGINASVADFDVVNKAKAGFNVNAGDVIKVYIVDQLTNDIDHNPIVLQ